MADIFISYKREDQPIAKDLANKLTGAGFSVWWDRNIPVGKAYDAVIEEELAKSKCIIVLWTVNSVTSLNVKEEAMEGLKRNILIPVVIGSVNLPYGFKMIQTLSWNNDNEIDSQEFYELTQQVARLLGNEGVILPEKPEEVIDKNGGGQINHKPEDRSQKTATLHFIKPNQVVSMVHSVVSLKSIEVSVKVYVDGEKVGSLISNETLVVTVTPGNHYVQVKGGGAFYGADKKIKLNAGDTLTLRIGTSITGGLKLAEV